MKTSLELQTKLEDYVGLRSWCVKPSPNDRNIDLNFLSPNGKVLFIVNIFRPMDSDTWMVGGHTFLLNPKELYELSR